MAKKTPIQSKNTTFCGKDLLSVTAFLQNFKSVCDAGEIQKEVVMRLLGYTSRDELRLRPGPPWRCQILSAPAMRARRDRIRKLSNFI